MDENYNIVIAHELFMMIFNLLPLHTKINFVRRYKPYNLYLSYFLEKCEVYENVSDSDILQFNLFTQRLLNVSLNNNVIFNKRFVRKLNVLNNNVIINGFIRLKELTLTNISELQFQRGIILNKLKFVSCEEFIVYDVMNKIKAQEIIIESDIDYDFEDFPEEFKTLKITVYPNSIFVNLEMLTIKELYIKDSHGFYFDDILFPKSLKILVLSNIQIREILDLTYLNLESGDIDTNSQNCIVRIKDNISGDFFVSSQVKVEYVKS